MRRQESPPKPQVSPEAGRREKTCFPRPDTRLPAENYPYFVASEGCGVAGRTGEDGCAPELYVPVAGPFAVYGGNNALEMNVNGPTG